MITLLAMSNMCDDVRIVSDIEGDVKEIIQEEFSKEGNVVIVDLQ